MSKASKAGGILASDRVTIRHIGTEGSFSSSSSEESSAECSGSSLSPTSTGTEVSSRSDFMRSSLSSC